MKIGHLLWTALVTTVMVLVVIAIGRRIPYVSTAIDYAISK